MQFTTKLDKSNRGGAYQKKKKDDTQYYCRGRATWKVIKAFLTFKLSRIKSRYLFSHRYKFCFWQTEPKNSAPPSESV